MEARYRKIGKKNKSEKIHYWRKRIKRVGNKSDPAKEDWKTVGNFMGKVSVPPAGRNEEGQPDKAPDEKERRSEETTPGSYR